METKLNEITKGLNFEDIQHPLLGFAAADLNSGELVTLNKGSINEAFRATVAAPGLFEPVVLGNKLLVDGGLVNLVPTVSVKEMGADIVIGVNLAATKFFFEKRLPIWRSYKFVNRMMGVRFFREEIFPKLWNRIMFRSANQSDSSEQEVKIPGVLSVLSKALDHSFRIESEWDEVHVACDVMIEPDVKHYGKTEFKNNAKIYEQGRLAAEAAVPQIQELIRNFKS